MELLNKFLGRRTEKLKTPNADSERVDRIAQRLREDLRRISDSGIYNLFFPEDIVYLSGTTTREESVGGFH